MTHSYFRNAAAHFRAQEVLTWSGFALTFSSLWYIFYGSRRVAAKVGGPVAPTRLSLGMVLEEEKKAAAALK